jgi:hypothetical protein
VDERHGGSLPGRRGGGHGRPEVVDQLADGLFGLLVTGFAAGGRRELAEQPQQQERLMRDPDLAGSRLAQSGQPCQELVASHPQSAGCALIAPS